MGKGKTEKSTGGILPDGTAVGERASSPNASGGGIYANYYKQWNHVELGTNLTGFVDMAWHHVIPWNKLRDVWTRVVQDQQWKLVEVWLKVIGIKDPNVSEIVNDIKGGNLGADDRDLIHERLTWSTWNIVEGPKNRNDDPGETYDKFRDAMGLDAGQLSQMIFVEKLWTAMDAINCGAKAPDGLIDHLEQALKGIPSANPIITFNDKTWKKVSDVEGRYMQDSNQPTWRKVFLGEVPVVLPGPKPMNPNAPAFVPSQKPVYPGSKPMNPNAPVFVPSKK